MGPSFGVTIVCRHNRPSAIEIPPFGWTTWHEHDEERPLVYPAGPALPPERAQRKPPGIRLGVPGASLGYDYGLLGKVRAHEHD